MKKILITICCCLNLFIADAQPTMKAKYDVHAGYGFISDVQIMAAFANLMTHIFSGISGEPLTTDYHTIGPLMGSCNFFLSRNISVGPELNLIQIKVVNRYSSGDVINDRIITANLSARFDFRYLNREKIQLYSGISLGGTAIFFHTTDPSQKNKAAPFIFLTRRMLFRGERMLQAVDNQSAVVPSGAVAVTFLWLVKPMPVLGFTM